MYHTLDELRNRDKTTHSLTKPATATNNDDAYIKHLKGKSTKEEYDKSKHKLQLKVYKNGFIINNEPFRSIEDTNNKKFLTEIEKGYIPQEYRDKGYKDLSVALENYKNEEYQSTPVQTTFKTNYIAFQGEGTSLNDINVRNNYHINETLSHKVNVDVSLPICKINIRLFNGVIINEEFNLCSKVSDVYKYVKEKSGCDKFQLMEGFPPKELADMEKTVEEVGVAGSVLIQKLCG